MFERNGSWMHVAVTWSVENDGETIVYKNGEIGISSLNPSFLTTFC